MRPSCTSPNTDKTLSSQAPSKSYFNACLPKLKFNTKQCLKLFLFKQVKLSKYTVISDFTIPLYYLYLYSCILVFFINYCESLDARLGIQNVSILTYNYDNKYGLPQPGLNEIPFPKVKFGNNNSYYNGNFTRNYIIAKKITMLKNKTKYLRDNNKLSKKFVISERYNKKVFFNINNHKNIHSIGNKTHVIGLGLVKDNNKKNTSDVIRKSKSNKYLRKKKSTVKYKGTNTIRNDTSQINGLIYSNTDLIKIFNSKKTIVGNESIYSDLIRNGTYRSSSAVKRVISSRHRKPRTNKKPILKGNSERHRVYGSGWNSFKKFQRPEVGAQRHGVVSLLGLFELSTRRGARPDGASELAAARLAVRHVNERRLLPGYRLELLTNDTQCDPGVGVDRFFHALYTKNTTRMVMLLGSACSEVTESLAKVVPYWNIVQVSFGSTSPALSDRNEFPLFYRTVAPDSSHNPARIAFIRKFRWDTVTAFSQNEEVYSLAVNELLTELESANITCAASITFAETDFREQLQLLKELDTRIIVGSFSSDMMPKIFCEAYRLGMYGADYVWMVQGGALPASGSSGTSPCSRAHLSAAMDRLILVASYNSIVRDDLPSLSGLTNQMFMKEMETVHVPLSVYAPQTYDAVWAIALALRGAEQTWRNGSRGTTEPPPPEDDVCSLSHFDYTRQDMAEDFLQQLGQLSFLGVSGPVSFSGADRVGTSAFYQIQEGEVRTVALYHPGARALDFACGPCAEPAWRDEPPVARRVRRRRLLPVAPAARAAGTALAVAGAALAGAFLAVNLHYSKLRSIKLSSPRLNNMTLVGCVLVYGAVALLGVDSATLPSFVRYSAICTGRVYLLSAGFSLAFGSMFAKTYRVHRIFISNRSGVCKTKLLQDTQLISLICALLLIDGLIVTLWVIIDPMERHLKNLTFEISKTDRSVVYQPQIEVCKSQHTAGWLSALYAYKGLLLIVGLYMAWETRHVKISALNDSKYIGISVYSVVITSISVVVLGNLISDRATLAYVTITGLILISTTSTLCLLFLPKMMSIIYKTEDEDPVVHSMGLKIECNTRRFVTDDTKELHYRVEIQNKVYKREMAVLDKEITRLEKILLDSNATTSNTSSSASIPITSKSELTVIHENSNRKHSQDDHHRTPSISGGLPLLLLSVLPPVIPRASWPSTESCNLSMRRSVTFSSQPKLNDRPAIDLYNLCLTKKNEENQGILSRLRNIFGSRAPSRKASTTSISGANTSQGIAAALKLHVGMIAGLVPGANKHPMVLSCNTLDTQGSQRSLRKESLAHSGPIINIVGYETPESQRSPLQKRKLSKSFPFEIFFKRDSQKETAEIQGHRVNFVLPKEHGRNAVSLQNSQIVSYKDRPKGSPRFPHKIVPTTSSLSALNDSRKTSSASISHISGTSNMDQSIRRSSHQPSNSRVLAAPTDKLKFPMGNRSKSMEDASLTLPGTRRGNGLLELSCIPSDIHPPKERCAKFTPNTDIWATARHGIPLSEFVAEYEGNKTKFVRKQTSDTSLS